MKNVQTNACNQHGGVVFVHSLFRSGSTYFYYALKRIGDYYVYHEPLHEIIASLPDSWAEITGSNDQLKATLRHNFLTGGYFGEYKHLLSSIRKTFNSKSSFEYYFMQPTDKSLETQAYFDMLIDGAPKFPIIQCTRTVGRVRWIKEHYESKHIFLLRNPWDQWYSYKVDDYIATTPRVIYSQENLPTVLYEVMIVCGAKSLPGADTQTKLIYGYQHPIDPTTNYFLFFGLWLHAFVTGRCDCNIFIDMDALSSSDVYRAHIITELEGIGINSIDLSDVDLHRAFFTSQELETYKIIEDQVFDVFRQYHSDTESVTAAYEYLYQLRNQEFTSALDLSAHAQGILEDSARMRALLFTHDQRDTSLILSLNQTVENQDGQVSTLDETVATQNEEIDVLGQTIEERDGQISTLDEAVTKRDEEIDALGQTIKERDGQISTLDETVTKRDKEIDVLGQTIEERDGQISTLDEAVTKRDEEIDALGQTIKERDGQISTLDETVTKRDKEIDVLGQTIEERDGQISTLDEAVTKRDEEIDALGQTIKERDGQISTLDETVTKRDKEIDVLGQTIEERDGQISTLDEAVTKRDEEIDALGQTIKERDGQVSTLTEETVLRGEWALRLDNELNEIKTKQQILTKSNSWRLTMPLREGRRWINTPFQQTKRYAKGGLGMFKRGYQSLPFSYQTKASHRRLITKLFPRILLLSGSSSTSIPSIVNPSVIGKNEPLSDAHITDIIVEFDTSKSPIVSVIIPVYGQIEYTMRCLESIQNNLPKIAFEVIVVDDCSPDNSVETLQKIKGINLLENVENQGFIRSCNAGAEVAKGEYLCFLNNDTEVKENWLDELLRTFNEFPGTGLAGSKLVYPDGRLQEAGGIIWQDGSAWNFGRFQDPLLPIYNYAREVDYCSGASIMVPKVLFDEFGGFDEHYLPAYCEDSDLALKIRSKGFRVIYQPLSTVIHYEGITSGTDTTQGTKAYQVVNTKKQYQRWKDTLSIYQVAGMDVDIAKDRSSHQRVLYIDHCTPTPDQDSGSIDAYNHMLLLREMGFQVTFIPEDNFLYMPKYTENLQRAGIEVLYAPYFMSVQQHMEESGERYNLIFLSRPIVAEQYLSMARKLCQNAKILFHTVDLHFLRMLRESELYENKWLTEALEMKNRELELINSSDITTVISKHELQLLEDYVSTKNIRLLPFSRNIEGTTKSFSERENIVFVGGFQHTPNIDAVQYFVLEVMPLLREELSNICFYVVGPQAPAEIKSLAADDIIISGFVEDLSSFLDKMRLSVAPLRYGAGIKGKIGTAMTIGLPVVATSLAAEGMQLQDHENIVIADGAEEFCHAIVKIYQDEVLWNKISKNGLDFSANAWGAEAAWNILASIINELDLPTTRNFHKLSLYSESISESRNKRSQFLRPVSSVKNRHEYKACLESNEIKQVCNFEKQLINSAQDEFFNVNAFCVPCNKEVPFLVDLQSGGKLQGNSWWPNWRERLECPECHMNNRQRLVATLIKQELEGLSNKNVYLMEQVTPIFNWVKVNFREHNIEGSEYLGYEYDGGSIIKGIRHEDVEKLSFTDSELDLIISNDVFEHVPNPVKAFSECARVLKKGAVMLATIPFHSELEDSVIRAKIVNGQLEHLLRPSYHGNPISAEGSLVFTDFGWDLLNDMKNAGFSNVNVDIFSSVKFGHLGGCLIVFKLVN